MLNVLLDDQNSIWGAFNTDPGPVTVTVQLPPSVLLSLVIGLLPTPRIMYPQVATAPLLTTKLWLADVSFPTLINPLQLRREPASVTTSALLKLFVVYPIMTFVAPMTLAPPAMVNWLLPPLFPTINEPLMFQKELLPVTTPVLLLADDALPTMPLEQEIDPPLLISR
jgi:hypothetical protein